MDAVRAEKPDVLVSTGDLLDGQIDGIEDLAEEFRKIKPPYGKYAVNGNHEYYVGIERARKFCKSAGFILLSNEIFDIPGVLVIAGMDDLTAGRSGPNGDFHENQILSRISKDRYVLLLKHRPLLNEASEGLFDLQLSGHTHRGQIFPFGLIIKMLYPNRCGVAETGERRSFVRQPGGGDLGAAHATFGTAGSDRH